MYVIIIKVNIGDFAPVLLQMRNHLARFHFPYSDIPLLSTWTKKFKVVRKLNRCYRFFMSIVNTPNVLTIFAAKHTDFFIIPTWDHNFFIVLETNRYSSWLTCTPGQYLIITHIPKSNCTINCTSCKLVRNLGWVSNKIDGFCVIFWLKPVFKIFLFDPVDKTLFGCCQYFLFILAYRKWSNATAYLSLLPWSNLMSVHIKCLQISITTSHYKDIFRNRSDRGYP